MAPIFEEDEESAYQLAYEAMLIAGRALMFSRGVKPRSVGAHKITVEFCEAFLGESYRLFIEKLDRARKKRHYLMYGIGQIISSTEARNLIETAVRSNRTYFYPRVSAKISLPVRVRTQTGVQKG